VSGHLGDEGVLTEARNLHLWTRKQNQTKSQWLEQSILYCAKISVKVAAFRGKKQVTQNNNFHRGAHCFRSNLESHQCEFKLMLQSNLHLNPTHATASKPPDSARGTQMRPEIRNCSYNSRSSSDSTEKGNHLHPVCSKIPRPPAPVHATLDLDPARARASNATAEAENGERARGRLTEDHPERDEGEQRHEAPRPPPRHRQHRISPPRL
jgi:hypothetical protein